MAVARPDAEGVRPPAELQLHDSAGPAELGLDAVRERHFSDRVGRLGGPIRQRQIDLLGVPQQGLEHAEVVLRGHVLGPRLGADPGQDGLLVGVQVEQPLQLASAQPVARFETAERRLSVLAPEEAMPEVIDLVEQRESEPAGGIEAGPAEAAERRRGDDRKR